MAEQKQLDPFVLNQGNRELLLKTATRERVILGKYGPYNLGETARIRLMNVGIVTRLRLIVEATVSGTITAYSKKAPYNLISLVKLIDFDGSDRISAPAFLINELSKVRYGMDDDVPVISNYALPVLPTSNGTMKFILDIPIAYDPEGDLRGSILAQTSTGEFYLQLQFNTLAYDSNNVDAVVTNGSSVNISDIYVTVIQEYLMPVPVAGQVPIPSLDVSTVYELVSLKTTDNIQNGVEKLINFPNVRNIYSVLSTVVNNKDLTWDNCDEWRILVNSNYTMRKYKLDDYIVSFRHMVQYDPTKGVYYVDFRSKPVETAIYGQVQLGMSMQGTFNSPYIEVLFESFYTRGVTLQGFLT